ncbi:MAG: aminomethyl-transferring glycine dehydrogenase subunit GcvPA [Nitrospiraceae bacterium]|nr:aminomethyl-transferring glycine dehydrogenase subunit GcvPA [Nitrospiraceae bacterium]
MTWIPATDAERGEMLAAIGVRSIDELFATIPEHLRLRKWQVPPGRSQMAVQRILAETAARNDTGTLSFVGGGYYDHHIPAAVDALASRSEFLTAYTPYQPECAQGTLQAVYEYQSAVCRLTDLECANASLYDGGTAVFEATTMAVRQTRRTRIVCHESLNPLYRRMLATHTANLELDIVDSEPASLDGAACVIVQNPSFLGTVRDFSDLAERCHAAGALLVVSFYPVSLGLLKTPGAMGADIAIAEGQSLGLPLSFGGPYLGIMAARQKLIRKMPGRIAAATQDAEGRRGFVLTLQAREQHIRREKATSNICSNEAHCALRALIHLCLLGREGLREVAVQCHAKAEYLKGRLIEGAAGIQLLNDGPTFNEFAVRLPADAESVVERLLDRGIHPGLPLAPLGAGERTDLLVAVTEKHTREDLDTLTEALEQALCN